MRPQNTVLDPSRLEWTDNGLQRFDVGPIVRLGVVESVDDLGRFKG